MLIRLANDDLVEYPDELGALVLAEPIHGDVPDFSLEELNCVINCTLGVLFDEKSPSGIKTTPPWFYSLWTGRFGQHRGAWGLGEFFQHGLHCLDLVLVGVAVRDEVWASLAGCGGLGGGCGRNPCIICVSHDQLFLCYRNPVPIGHGQRASTRLHGICWDVKNVNNRP